MQACGSGWRVKNARHDTLTRSISVLQAVSSPYPPDILRQNCVWSDVSGWCRKISGIAGVIQGSLTKENRYGKMQRFAK